MASLCSLCFGQEKEQKAAEPSKDAAPASSKPQQNGLKKLEDDLFKPLKTISPGNSLDGVFVTPQRPPPARPQDDQKLREKRNREKDWVFMNPDEILKGSTDEKFSNVPGNEKKDAEKSKLSPVEQYYLRTFHLDRDKKDSDKRTEAKKKDPNASSRYGNAGLLEEDEDSDADLPPGLRETQRALKSLSGDGRPSAKPAANANGFFSDIFGLGQAMPTAADLEAKRVQKERMDEFKKLLGMPVTVSATDSLNPLNGLGVPTTPAPAASLPSVSSLTKPGAANVQLGTISGLPGLSQSSVPTASTALYPAPAADPPKPRQPPATTFNAPRRPF